MTSILLCSLVRKQLWCPFKRNLNPVASCLYLLPGNRRSDHVLGHTSIRGHRFLNHNDKLVTNHYIQWSHNLSGQRLIHKNSIQKPTFLTRVPSHGEVVIKRLLPKSLVPYAQLMRLDKPTGTLLLLWPSYWSILMATPAGQTPDLTNLSLFLIGAILMRGAGCTINDLWDKKYDAQVARTEDRPSASGKIKTVPALFFLAAQLSSALYILTRFDEFSIILGASSMALVVTYPLAKRYTHWAQLLLGMTFNWGALLGYSVVKGGLTSGDLYAVLPLYLAGISWTLIYDTIYAHQDKSDDLIIGLKSTAIKFGDSTKSWLSVFSVVMVTSLVTSGVATYQTWPYYASVGLIGGHLFNQIVTLKIDDPEDCWKKFKMNANIGVILASGLFVSTLFKDKEREKDYNQDNDH